MKRAVTSSCALVAMSTPHCTDSYLATQTRSISQIANSSSLRANTNWRTFWKGVGQKNPAPSNLANTPIGVPKLRKTHIEWKHHHGSGGRVGRYDETRYVADFEHADGTPAPATQTRHALMHFHDKQLAECILAGAVVEELARTNRLPRVPGVKEQRDWDPEIPLFLKDQDEHGEAPPLSYDAGNTDIPTRIREARAKHIDDKYANAARAMDGKTIIKSPSMEGEGLTPITMFASYSPAKMMHEKLERRPKTVSPVDRRRWNMTDSFLVYKGPKPKNTIADGGAKIQ